MPTQTMLEKQVKTIGKLLNIPTEISVKPTDKKYLFLCHHYGYKLILKDPSDGGETPAFNLPNKRFTAEQIDLILTGIITGIKQHQEITDTQAIKL